MFTGPNDPIPYGYDKTGMICDDAKQCHCIIPKTGGCDSSDCIANGRDGMCIGKFDLQRYFTSQIYEKFFSRSRCFWIWPDFSTNFEGIRHETCAKVILLSKSP